MSEPIIRPIRSEDFADIYECRTQPNVVWGTLQVPTVPPEIIQAQCGFQPNHYNFVAEVDGKAVGMCGIGLSSGTRSRHAAGLGMMVHDAYQNRGLGRRLMAAALDLADNYLGLERVELDVYVDNPRAIKLYKDFGFVEEGTIRTMARRGGEYVDALQMGRLRGLAAVTPPTLIPDLTQKPEQAGARPTDLKVRPVCPEDARAVYDIFLQPGVLAHLDQHSAIHPDEIRKQVTGLVWGQHLAVATIGGKVVGAAYLQQARQGRRGHVGFIHWIAVDNAFQNRGVGTALLEFLVNLADGWLNVRKLEIKVPADDLPALALIRKFGFATEAVLRSAFFRNGQYVDVCALGRDAYELERLSNI